MWTRYMHNPCTIVSAHQMKAQYDIWSGRLQPKVYRYRSRPITVKLCYDEGDFTKKGEMELAEIS